MSEREQTAVDEIGRSLKRIVFSFTVAIGAANLIVVGGGAYASYDYQRSSMNQMQEQIHRLESQIELLSEKLTETHWRLEMLDQKDRWESEQGQ
jgi:hypothetical protein